MNTMFDFLDRIQVQKEPGPEQYLGEDGLIYCGKCHTPFNAGSHLRAENGSCPASANARRKNENSRNSV